MLGPYPDKRRGTYFLVAVDAQGERTISTYATEEEARADLRDLTATLPSETLTVEEACAKYREALKAMRRRPRTLRVYESAILSLLEATRPLRDVTAGYLQRRVEARLGEAMKTRRKGHSAVEGGLKEPLAFGLLTGSAGMMFEIFWQFLLFGEIGDTLSSFVDTLWGSDATILLSLGIMALCPLLVLITTLIASTILHVLLSLVRGGKSGFEATFRVISFSQSAQLWGVIPIVGSLIGAVWLVAVQVIGLRQIHETSYLRVTMALMIPFALLLVLVVIMVI